MLALEGGGADGAARAKTLTRLGQLLLNRVLELLPRNADPNVAGASAAPPGHPGSPRLLLLLLLLLPLCPHPYTISLARHIETSRLTQACHVSAAEVKQLILDAQQVSAQLAEAEAAPGAAAAAGGGGGERAAFAQALAEAERLL